MLAPGSAAASCGNVSEAKAKVVTVEWFVGLGTGSNKDQIAVERRAVDAFNRQHDDVKLRLTVADSGTGPSVFKERMDQGDLPDIIGPIGVGPGGEWADQIDSIDESAVDLSGYPEDQIRPYRAADGSLLGVPIGVYPAVVFYNKDLFTRAKLPFPPHAEGETYRGTTWDWDNLRATAMLLTLDATGKHPGEPGFNPDKRVQWGFHDEYVNEGRPLGALFGSGSLLAADGSAQIPPTWQTGWEWYHDMVWKDFSVPTTAQSNSAVLSNGSPFISGNLAMATSHSWFAPSLEGLPAAERPDWDVAIMPSYNGTTTSRSHADSFRMLKTATPKRARTMVMDFFANDAAADLIEAFGPIPSRVDLRDDYLKRQRTRAPEIDWNVFLDSVQFADQPNHGIALRNNTEVTKRLETFYNGIVDDQNFDVASESKVLLADVAQIVGTKPSPTTAPGG